MKPTNARKCQKDIIGRRFFNNAQVLFVAFFVSFFSFFIHNNDFLVYGLRSPCPADVVVVSPFGAFIDDNVVDGGHRYVINASADPLIGVKIQSNETGILSTAEGQDMNCTWEIMCSAGTENTNIGVKVTLQVTFTSMTSVMMGNGSSSLAKQISTLHKESWSGLFVYHVDEERRGQMDGGNAVAALTRSTILPSSLSTDFTHTDVQTLSMDQSEYVRIQFQNYTSSLEKQWTRIRWGYVITAFQFQVQCIHAARTSVILNGGVKINKTVEVEESVQLPLYDNNFTVPSWPYILASEVLVICPRQFPGVKWSLTGGPSSFLPLSSANPDTLLTVSMLTDVRKVFVFTSTDLKRLTGGDAVPVLPGNLSFYVSTIADASVRFYLHVQCVRDGYHVCHSATSTTQNSQGTSSQVQMSLDFDEVLLSDDDGLFDLFSLTDYPKGDDDLGFTCEYELSCPFGSEVVMMNLSTGTTSHDEDLYPDFVKANYLGRVPWMNVTMFAKNSDGRARIENLPYDDAWNTIDHGGLMEMPFSFRPLDEQQTESAQHSVSLRFQFHGIGGLPLGIGFGWRMVLRCVPVNQSSSPLASQSIDVIQEYQIKTNQLNRSLEDLSTEIPESFVSQISFQEVEGKGYSLLQLQPQQWQFSCGDFKNVNLTMYVGDGTAGGNSIPFHQGSYIQIRSPEGFLPLEKFNQPLNNAETAAYVASTFTTEKLLRKDKNHYIFSSPVSMDWNRFIGFQDVFTMRVSCTSQGRNLPQPDASSHSLIQLVAQTKVDVLSSDLDGSDQEFRIPAGAHNWTWVLQCHPRRVPCRIILPMVKFNVDAILTLSTPHPYVPSIYFRLALFNEDWSLAKEFVTLETTSMGSPAPTGVDSTTWQTVVIPNDASNSSSSHFGRHAYLQFFVPEVARNSAPSIAGFSVEFFADESRAKFTPTTSLSVGTNTNTKTISMTPPATPTRERTPTHTTSLTKPLLETGTMTPTLTKEIIPPTATLMVSGPMRELPEGAVITVLSHSFMTKPEAMALTYSALASSLLVALVTRNPLVAVQTIRLHQIVGSIFCPFDPHFDVPMRVEFPLEMGFSVDDIATETHTGDLDADMKEEVNNESSNETTTAAGKEEEMKKRQQPEEEERKRRRVDALLRYFRGGWIVNFIVWVLSPLSILLVIWLCMACTRRRRKRQAKEALQKQQEAENEREEEMRMTKTRHEEEANTSPRISTGEEESKTTANKKDNFSSKKKKKKKAHLPVTKSFQLLCTFQKHILTNLFAVVFCYSIPSFCKYVTFIFGQSESSVDWYTVLICSFLFVVVLLVLFLFSSVGFHSHVKAMKRVGLSELHQEEHEEEDGWNEGLQEQLVPGDSDGHKRKMKKKMDKKREGDDDKNQKEKMEREKREERRHFLRPTFRFENRKHFSGFVETFSIFFDMTKEPLRFFHRNYFYLDCILSIYLGVLAGIKLHPPRLGKPGVSYFYAETQAGCTLLSSMMSFGALVYLAFLVFAEAIRTRLHRSSLLGYSTLLVLVCLPVILVSSYAESQPLGTVAEESWSFQFLVFFILILEVYFIFQLLMVMFYAYVQYQRRKHVGGAKEEDGSTDEEKEMDEKSAHQTLLIPPSSDSVNNNGPQFGSPLSSGLQFPLLHGEEQVLPYSSMYPYEEHDFHYLLPDLSSTASGPTTTTSLAWGGASVEEEGEEQEKEKWHFHGPAASLNEQQGTQHKNSGLQWMWLSSKRKEGGGRRGKEDEEDEINRHRRRQQLRLSDARAALMRQNDRKNKKKKEKKNSGGQEEEEGKNGGKQNENENDDEKMFHSASPQQSQDMLLQKSGNDNDECGDPQMRNAPTEEELQEERKRKAEREIERQKREKREREQSILLRQQQEGGKQVDQHGTVHGGNNPILEALREQERLVWRYANVQREGGIGHKPLSTSARQEERRHDTRGLLVNAEHLRREKQTQSAQVLDQALARFLTERQTQQERPPPQVFVHPQLNKGGSPSEGNPNDEQDLLL